MIPAFMQDSFIVVVAGLGWKPLQHFSTILLSWWLGPGVDSPSKFNPTRWTTSPALVDTRYICISRKTLHEFSHMYGAMHTPYCCERRSSAPQTTKNSMSSCSANATSISMNYCCRDSSKTGCLQSLARHEMVLYTKRLRDERTWA